VTVIAIDGPAGAGKSTAARGVARALGWRYVDTGAMYRSVALAARERGEAVDDGAALARVARSLDFEATAPETCSDASDVGARLRDPSVTRTASRVASHPEVRAVLVERQRALARHNDIVMEGRDIGTTVVPDAAIKIFLTAALEARAARRLRDLALPDDEDTRARVQAALAARDEADSSRPTSPLMRAADAMVIDTTNLGPDEVIARIVAAARARGVLA
jgi:cytidylate kinase